MGPTPDRSAVRLALVTTVILILVAACSTGGAGASSGTSGAPAATTAASSAASPAAASSTSSGGGRYGDGGDEYSYGGTDTATPAPGGAAKVHTVRVANGRDGRYLTGEGGMTLYVFGNDTANTSTCDAECAKTWPPFTIAKGDSLEGAGGITEPLTAIKRSDGSLQVAHARSPLYYYVGDKAPGDTKGQGVGDVWFIAQP